MPITSLEVSRIELNVFLGCSDQERAKTQKIEVSLEVRFSSNPAATESDNIEDTVCYDEAVTQLLLACEEKEFRTIEHLAKSAYDSLKQTIVRTQPLRVSVHKLAPPIPQLKGGAFFRIGDF